MSEERSLKKQKLEHNNNMISDSNLLNSKLNEYLFNIISIHLVYNNSIENILELSLLSKSVFSKIQSILISKEFNKYEFPIKIDKLIDYIKKSSNNNNNNKEQQEDQENNNYKFKLIQYKDIEKLKIKYLKKNRFSSSKYSNDEIKRILNENCKKLKNVIIMGKVQCDTESENDYTMDGFFKLKKLQMFVDCEESLPLTREEHDNFDWDLDPSDDFPHYNFSFSFLKNYNPKTLYIETSLNEYALNIINLKNIFNCKSIKSLAFKDHKTPIEFFKSSLQNSKSLKSLTCILNIENEEDDEEDNEEEEEEEEEEEDNNNSISKLLSNVKIESNKSLKKLKFNRCFEDEKEYQFNQDSLIPIIKSLKHNKSINSLGLYAFNILDSKVLKGLIKIPTINKLYILIENNADDNNQNQEKSLKSILNHLNENSNIKELKINFEISKNTDDDNDEEQDIQYEKNNNIRNEIFLNYFNNNKSSLEYLTVKYIDRKDNFDYGLSQVLLNSKSNSNINLKIIKKNV